MNCQECELLIAGGGEDVSVEEHLRECPACRALSEELRANAAALPAMRDEELPRLAPLKVQRAASATPWMSAVAAAAVLAVALSGIWQATRPVPPEPVKGKPEEITVRAEPEKTEQMTVKILTPDPDVVIYWLMDSKEGNQ